MSAAARRKEPVFENVFVGESFGPVELSADEHNAKAFAFAVDDFNPWYLYEPTPFGGRIFPSVAVVNDLLCVYHEKYDFNSIAGLHQKEEVAFHRPIPLGTKLLLSGSYVDKFVRRGKGYVILDAQARDERGNLYVEQRSIEIMRVPQNVELGSGAAEPTGRRVRGVWPADREPIAAFVPGVAAGTPIAPLAKSVHQDQMSVYSGVDRHKRNIHTDAAFARKFGFPATLAQGMMEGCYLSQLCSSFFGPSWLEHGRFTVAFLKPVFAGDELTCRAIVSSVSDGPNGTDCELEMWITKSNGEMTAAGWATCSVGR